MSDRYKETESTLRLAMFVSGGGSTMKAIATACERSGPLYGLVVPTVVIADRDCQGVSKAVEMEIPVRMIQRTDFPKGHDRTLFHGRGVLTALADYRPDIVTQNGWLSLTSPEIVDVFAGRIFNQHPAPLDPGHVGAGGEPLHFGGAGIFGRAAHESVLVFQKLTGRQFPTEATIHRVTPEFDRGAVVYRREVEVVPDDTAETLAARVLPHEHYGHVVFLWQLHEGAVEEMNRVTPLVHDSEEHVLYQAKDEARHMYPHG